MKPLLPNKTAELLTRIDDATDGELVSIIMNNPQNFTVELSVQDKNRGYDWINIAFEIDGVIDANLLDEGKLSLVDMSEGITLLFEEGLYGIGVGDYKSIEALKSAPVYLIGNALKYEERPFSS
jgi:hypothetical protein